MWIEPVAAHVTSEAVLAQEEAILTWAIDAQTAEPAPSLDGAPWRVGCVASRRRRSGRRRRPVGVDRRAGRCRQDHDAARRGRRFPRCPAPPGVRFRPDRQSSPGPWNARPGCSLTRSPNCSTNGPAPTAPTRRGGSAGATIVVDEAGMLQHRRPAPADPPRRRVRIGGSCSSATHASCKPSAAVGCSTSCAPPGGSSSWNGSIASPTRGKQPRRCKLRHGDPRALDAYEAHGRIIPGTLVEHLDTHRQLLDRTPHPR